MSEFRMLGAAFLLMIISSAAAAFIMQHTEATPVALLSVTTIAALLSYTSVCLYCLPRIHKSATQDEPDVSMPAGK